MDEVFVALNATDPPTWVQLLPPGVFTGRDGRGPYRLDAEAVLKAFAAGGIDLPIDYEHQSLADNTGPVPAAGWIKELEVRDGALWARVEWTPRAAELIKGREYRYLSPVFRHDKTGRVVAIEGAALTHYPNLRLAAFRKGDAMPAFLATIIDALGLPPDTDEEKLVAHVKELREMANKAASTPDPREWVPMSQYRSVAQELSSLQAQVAKEKAEAAVLAAMSAGKLAPAMRDWALAYAEKDPKGFDEWAAAAPVIVPVDAGVASHSTATSASADLTDEDRYVCAKLGISEVDFIAHKRAMTKE